MSVKFDEMINHACKRWRKLPGVGAPAAEGLTAGAVAVFPEGPGAKLAGLSARTVDFTWAGSTGKADEEGALPCIANSLDQASQIQLMASRFAKAELA